MVKVTLKGVLKTEACGKRTWAGYTTEESIEGLRVHTIDMLDPEDGSDNRWVLAAPAAISLLTDQDIEELKAGELRRCTLAKLSDSEISALGLTRE